VLRATSPIGRVVEPAEVAVLAVHLMRNSAVTGAACDVDGVSGLAPDTLARSLLLAAREAPVSMARASTRANAGATCEGTVAGNRWRSR
jgi:hypothetical protein